MQRDIISYIDSFGLIVQKDGDGGDTANRMGLWFIARFLEGQQLLALKLAFTKVLEKLEIRPGIYIRHPIIEKIDMYTPRFWYDPSEFSRDQQTPLVICMGYLNMHIRLKRILRNHLLRLGKYQNLDIAAPHHWGIYVRAFKKDSILAWCFLFFSDFFILLNSFVLCFIKGIDKDNVGDNLNHSIVVIQSIIQTPTPISRLARWLYVKYYPHGGIQRAWDHYFRDETGAPPMNEIYRPVIKKYLS